MHKDIVKFGHVVFEICEQTDRQTEKHMHPSQYIARPGVK